MGKKGPFLGGFLGSDEGVGRFGGVFGGVLGWWGQVGRYICSIYTIFNMYIELFSLML